MKLLLDTCIWGGAKVHFSQPATMWFGPATSRRIPATSKSWRKLIKNNVCSSLWIRILVNWPFARTCLIVGSCDWEVLALGSMG